MAFARTCQSPTKTHLRNAQILFTLTRIDNMIFFFTPKSLWKMELNNVQMKTTKPNTTPVEESQLEFAVFQHRSTLSSERKKKTCQAFYWTNVHIFEWQPNQVSRVSMIEYARCWRHKTHSLIFFFHSISYCKWVSCKDCSIESRIIEFGFIVKPTERKIEQFILAEIRKYDERDEMKFYDEIFRELFRLAFLLPSLRFFILHFPFSSYYENRIFYWTTTVQFMSFEMNIQKLIHLVFCLEELLII